MTFTKRIFDKLYLDLENSSSDDPQSLNNALRLLSKWRHALIQNTLIQNNGTKILAGPFKGLEFLSSSLEGCYVPKLLGCYEQPLHKTIEKIISTNYDFILNIGSAEGYYSAGFSSKMPNSIIMAFDLNKAVKEPLINLLKKNKITNCIYSDDKFLPEWFSKYKEKKTLVFCDIEGAELDLLDPSLAPVLKDMDIVVEAHDCYDSTISKQLSDRFSVSHRIKIINDYGGRNLKEIPDWFNTLAHLDQLLAVWEWRSGPTPWLVMESNSGK